MDRGTIISAHRLLRVLAIFILLSSFSGFNAPPRPQMQPHPVITLNGATDSCTWNGIPLYGKVKFVTSFPDIKIKFVESFPDLKVKFVESFPDECGEWQIVESFPDFTVKAVESFPDLTVQPVNSFPGVP